MYLKRSLLLLALFLSSSLAVAQAQPGDLTQYINATPSTDWSVRMWQSILGGFAKAPFENLGAATTLLSKMLLFFNGAIFIVGVAWLFYGVISGVLGTAQDGQAMGKRINSTWYPIRVVTGISGMAPILGGFTLSQGLLMWTAMLGIGIANTIYLGAVSDPQLSQLVGTSSITGAPVVRPSQVVNTVESMFRSNVCLLSHRNEAAEYVKDAQDCNCNMQIPDTSEFQVTFRPEISANGIKLRYGTLDNPEVCGSVGVMLERTRGADSATSFRVQSVDYNAIRNGVAVAAAQKLLAANELVRPWAEAYFLSIQVWKASSVHLEFVLDTAQLETIASQYIGDLRKLIETSLENSGSSITLEAQARMRETGWFGAGAWHSTFAEANAALADAVSGIKLYSQPPTEALTRPVSEDMRRLERQLERAHATRAEVSGTNQADAVLTETLKDVCKDKPILSKEIGTQTGNCSLGQAIVSQIIGGTMRGSGGGSAASGAVFFGVGTGEVGLVNPISAFKNLGDYVMTVGSTLVASNFMLEKAAAKAGWVAASATKWIGTAGAAVGIPGAAGVAAAGGAAQTAAGLAESAATYAIPMGWGLLALGAFMSVYIPMLPFLVWFGGLLTYAASFLEGLIAMPLHSMSHLDTDGEGMGQRTGRGYLFFLNTLVRPAIMVMAFFIASALAIALGTILAHLYLPAMANVQGNSVTGLASIIGLLAIYAVMNVILIQGCFDLVTTIADRIISFLGAGDMSGSIGQGAEGKINSLFLHVQRSGSISMQGSAAAGAELRKK